MSKQRANISVVIPAYGECPHLTEVVEALLEQSLPPSEIIVVHSGNADPTSALSDYKDSVALWHYDQRKLAGTARNIGMQKSGSEWVAFVDADAVPARNWLEELVAGTIIKPHCFAVGSVSYASTGGYWGMCLWIAEFGSVHPYLPARVMESGASANMLAPRQAVLDVGGFAEAFQPGEDTALHAKLRERGHTLLFRPNAVVRHYNPPGCGYYLAHLYQLGFCSARVRRQHKNLTGHKAVSFPILGAALWLARFLVISYRLLRWGSGLRRFYVVLAPGLLAGVIAWNIGFCRAVRK